MSLTVMINEKLIKFYSRGKLDRKKRSKIVACYEKIIEKTPEKRAKLIYMDEYCAFLKDRRMGKMLAAEAERMFRTADLANDEIYMAAAKEYVATAYHRMKKNEAGQMLQDALSQFEAIDMSSLDGSRKERVMFGKANMLFTIGSRAKTDDKYEIQERMYGQALKLYDELVHSINPEKYLLDYISCANDISIIYKHNGNIDKQKELLEACYPDISGYCKEKDTPSFYEIILLMCVCLNLAETVQAAGDRERAETLRNEALNAVRAGYKKYPFMLCNSYKRILITMLAMAQAEGDKEKEQDFAKEYTDYELDIKKRKSYAPSGSDYDQMSNAEINLLGNMDNTPESGAIIY